MSEEEQSPALPTRPVVREQTVALVQSMLVDWRVLEHLESKGMIRDPFINRDDAGCCAPDGGTCCVNKKQRF